MNPTKNNWSADLMIIDERKCPDYFNISSGHRFHEKVSQRGFGITGYMAADDAAILGNAKAMYDALKMICKDNADSFARENAAKVLAKIEKTFKRLEKENSKAKKAAE
ncbi:hypothetical protein EOM81_11470 [bacterium]|nr:hypothetical protein [bacterium]